MPNFKVVDRITLDRRFESGVDWGSDLHVLVEAGRKKLLWWTSHKTWGGRMSGYRHTPGELLLWDNSREKFGWRTTKTLHEGGRLSGAVLAAHAADIDAFFGCEVSQHLNPKITIIIGEE